jgi:hypothetical protein
MISVFDQKFPASYLYTALFFMKSASPSGARSAWHPVETWGEVTGTLGTVAEAGIDPDADAVIALARESTAVVTRILYATTPSIGLFRVC